MHWYDMGGGARVFVGSWGSSGLVYPLLSLGNQASLLLLLGTGMGRVVSAAGSCCGTSLYRPARIISTARLISSASCSLFTQLLGIQDMVLGAVAAN